MEIHLLVNKGVSSFEAEECCETQLRSSSQGGRGDKLVQLSQEVLHMERGISRPHCRGGYKIWSVSKQVGSSQGTWCNGHWTEPVSILDCFFQAAPSPRVFAVWHLIPS